MPTMCDERERLIGYIYEESTASERQELQAHLAECHVCRAEIAGLRDIRQDLLAWDVPKHEPIWRPMLATRSVTSWTQAPAWILAAAASLVFAAGLAGGVATRFLWPAAPGATVVATGLRTGQPVAAAPGAISVTSNDLAALEARVLDRVRGEMQRLQAVSSRESGRQTAMVPVGAQVTEGSLEVVRRQLADFERWRNDQIGLNVELDRKINRLSSRTASLDTQWQLSGMDTLRVNNVVGPETGR